MKEIDIDNCEENVNYRERTLYYLQNLVTAMSFAIKYLEYKKTDLHQMVHNIIKDIEAEASNAFLERKEK